MEDSDLVDALDAADDENDIDRIDPPPEVIKLKCGLEVRLLDLRTRQLFALLRIITHGAGTALTGAGIDFSDKPEIFLQKLLSVVLFSIPDAAQEAIDFLQSMVEPVDLIDKMPRDLSEKEREHNISAWTEVNRELWNPDPEDTLDIIEAVVKREADDLQALGKRIRRFLELAAKTGQLKPGAGGRQDQNSQASSPGSSTSSAASTGGRTRRSSTSRSAGSVTSSRPSRRASGKKSAAEGP